jgi:hypothetical protein
MRKYWNTEKMVEDVRSICNREDLSIVKKVEMLLNREADEKRCYKSYNIDFKVNVDFGLYNQGAESIELLYGYSGFYIEFTYEEQNSELLGLGQIRPDAIVKFDLR